MTTQKEIWGLAISPGVAAP
jgi:hypothetical protein